MFVEFNYEPLIEDFYNDGKMRAEAILRIMENAGNRHSDMAGNGLLEGSSKGQAWILTDWFVKLNKVPVYGNKITVKTWINSGISLFGCDRQFELYANGELCGFGISKFVLFDLNANRPIKVTPEFAASYGPEDKTVYSEKKLPKINMPENFTSEAVLQPRRNDIDFNHHVHNLVYVDYAMEALPVEIYDEHDFKNIRITYKNAVKAGESIKIKYAELENGKHTVCIYGSDDTLKTLLEFSK